MILDIVLSTVLIICFFTDLTQQKIYNIVIFPSLAAAIILNVWYGGIGGLAMSLLGFITGLGILILPYYIGGIGAGDVKLLSIIGAFKGSIFVINAAIYMAVTGGIIALIIILYRKQTINFFKTIFTWLFYFFIGIKYKLNFSTSTFSNKYPYGTAIVMGALICLLFKEAWII